MLAAGELISLLSFTVRAQRVLNRHFGEEFLRWEKRSGLKDRHPSQSRAQAIGPRDLAAGVSRARRRWADCRRRAIRCRNRAALAIMDVELAVDVVDMSRHGAAGHDELLAMCFTVPQHLEKLEHFELSV